MESYRVPSKVSGRSCEHKDIGKCPESQRRIDFSKQRCMFWENTGRSKDFRVRKQMDWAGSRN